MNVFRKRRKRRRAIGVDVSAPVVPARLPPIQRTNDEAAVIEALEPRVLAIRRLAALDAAVMLGETLQPFVSGAPFGETREALGESRREIEGFEFA